MIPFLDLKAQYRSIQTEIRAALDEVLENTAFVLGPAVARFEEKFAAYCGVKHCLGVNSGTSALHLALLAAGIQPGDEVIAPAMTFIATVSAIDYVGARPVLVDVHPESYCIDPSKIEARITRKTKAIVPVHLYGQSADMDPILEVARKHGLAVIEDAAQAHGAEYRGRRCGSMGDIACFSFYPGKNLGAYGEGGAVVTSRDDLAKTVRMLRDWGQEKKGLHALRGFNYRMEGFQGAVLGVKLEHLEAWTEGRRQAARMYDERLGQVPGIAAPKQMGYARHVYHVYGVLVANRDAVAQSLQQKSIGTNVHYPVPIHLHPCFAELGHKRGDFPMAERLAEQELSLPMYAELNGAQVEEVSAALRAAAGGRA
ncbi:MAG TPA: DegT/DnrJ/EryC1/StrS family aminotransferase [Candidatus Saccharimonadales bacterium]|nr:DegT/DnrJ/EryC1/StrS family aminotransferase [Candidatus Saccharimonadales bacterium]